jgi:pyruvate/2-oxoglutarate dehydrogenase complex dihydrolipoamide dehydrogenase (E3) component
VPARLLIVGGGYVAVEFGQMFARFGSQVTIIERSGQLLAREDTDIASEIADLLRDEGITILTNAEATELAEGEDGGIIATIRADDGDQTLTGSHLLLAVGRVPNTDALRPAAGGVELNKRGYIQVDDKLRTTATGVYAVGDVKGGPAFTHISYDDYRVLAANLLHGKDRSIGDRLLAYTIFTDPQLGRVGMSERQATQAGRKVRVAKMPMSYVARAIEVGETRGLMKAIVDADSDQILGAAVFGIQGGELVSAIQVAMLGKVPYTVLRDAPFAHPTLAESLNNLFGALA